MMIQLTLTQATPLMQETDGTVRLSGSRITLGTLVGAYEKGATAEQIQDSFPSLSLRQIYGTIAYYLEHEAEVKAYLQLRCAEAQALRQTIESQQDTAGFRARVRVRHISAVVWEGRSVGAVCL